MVHRRELNGQELVFGNQGDLWQNAMTWFDHGTGSVWSQPTGEAIMGPLTGNKLELLPSSLSTWADWKLEYPDTLALDTFTRETRFSLDQMAVVVAVDGDSVAIPIEELRNAGAIPLEVGGEPLIVTLDPVADRWAAYSRVRGDRTVDLSLVDGSLVDSETGDQWDVARGISSTGQDQLERIPAFSSFPKDYVRIFADGQVLLEGELWPSSTFLEG